MLSFNSFRLNYFDGWDIFLAFTVNSNNEIRVMHTGQKIFSLAACLLIFPLLLTAQDNRKLARQADSLYKAYEEQEALNLYEQLLDREPGNLKALWRASFLYSRLGHTFDNEDRQKKYYNKAISLAERALAADSTSSQANFVMAVAKGRKALISGTKQRVAASRAIKKYADLALRYDSTNAGAWHVLGRWNFKIANLSWLERLAANTLFGGIPGDASNEKAARYIKKAISLDDQYILYYYDLAQVYKALGREAKAIETCQEAINLPVLVPRDVELKQQCETLIHNL